MQRFDEAGRSTGPCVKSSQVPPDGKRLVEETAEIRMRELDAATSSVADLQEQVKTVDANAATIAEAVPSLLNLLEADHPGNYCEMTASASDGTPVVITYQRGDRPRSSKRLY